jgi:hypothetical protein
MKFLLQKLRKSRDKIHGKRNSILSGNFAATITATLPQGLPQVLSR